MAEVFLGREALGDGMSRSDLRRFYRPLFRGVYVPNRSVPTLYDRCVGAWLTSDRTGVIAGVAASALHGADWVDPTVPIELLGTARRRQQGLVIRMDRHADDEVCEIAELPVTSVPRTAYDLGRLVRRYAAIGRLDALMRAAPFEVGDVLELVQRYGPARGVCQLRELLALVDPKAMSPRESWLRLLLVDNGFPVPETQIPVVENGVVLAFLDMGWRDLKLAVEYDGEQHRTDRDQYVRDIRRLPMVERKGWEVIRVLKEDSAAEVITWVREAYARRGGELDEMARFTRTNAPKRSFGRNREVA
jgi:hypothetical protein